MFSALAAGTLSLATGLIGFTLSVPDASSAGTHWTGGPIWWQVWAGVGLLLLGVYWFRRLPSAQMTAPKRK